MVSFCTGAPTTLNEHDDDLTFILTLQYWGVPENPTRLDLRIWETQELFLRLYAQCGKFVRSADAAGISRQCIYKWQNADRFGFNERLEIAHQAYVERLEQEMDQYIRESKHNTQILQMFRLKAEAPEKYREDVRPANNDASQELLDRLTAMAAKDIAERRKLEEGATEGEYRELGETDRN
jgi:Fe-S cluster biosynthesis and repair protein YggX